MAVALGLHDDVRELVDDDVEGSLVHQRSSDVDLTDEK